jgi:hypothetical protein
MRRGKYTQTQSQREREREREREGGREGERVCVHMHVRGILDGSNNSCGATHRGVEFFDLVEKAQVSDARLQLLHLYRLHGTHVRPARPPSTHLCVCVCMHACARGFAENIYIYAHI